MDNNTLEISIEIIANAGNAKSLALEAIDIAKTKNYQEAINKLKEAREALTKVHKFHACLLEKDMGDKKLNINLLFIHAQDHLTSAIIILDLAEHLINLYTDKK